METERKSEQKSEQKSGQKSEQKSEQKPLTLEDIGERELATEMGMKMWHPVVFHEPPAEPATSPLGPIVLAHMEDAEAQWDAIVTRVSPEQGAQLEADRAYHKDQMCDAAYGAAFAVLGTDTVEKIRTAVYSRAAASFMERCLQAELLELFGTANEGFLRDIWGGIDVDAGYAAMAEYQAKRRQQAAEPTTE